VRAQQLREAFTGFFAARGHAVVPSASLVPADPTVMFTIAGMVPFKPYFLGTEPAPWPRATSVQKCFRTVDIEIVGSTERHCTFFEMLGNFSFGDYFKHEAIAYAWQLVTEVLGIDPERLWATVHEHDDEAAGIWQEVAELPKERIQRMGDDNFWRMGDTGPCGPSSELYVDRGERFGAGGGPAAGDPERYVEVWNLVFMQYERLPDGRLVDLPTRNIDTGAGLERLLPVLQGVDSMFATDVMAPVLDAAQQAAGRRYGRDARSDAALRVVVDHARAATALVADGVLPSNEGRGYVLRRVVRRAVRRALELGAPVPLLASLAAVVADVLGEAYPELGARLDVVQGALEREELAARRTLEAGLGMLEAVVEEELASGRRRIPGAVAFRLHDTYGFPVELTEEIAAERGVTVDHEGFERAMEAQRERARRAQAGAKVDERERVWLELLERHGPSEFVGYDAYECEARVLEVLERPDGRIEVVLDRTPFYAEAGGQVGDTGTIRTPSGEARVEDTTSPVPGLVVHLARPIGALRRGEPAFAAIDAERREALRRNHTGTHLLHAALRQVLGEHVRQQGSLVAPERLRFDFSHHAGLAPEELRAVMDLANADVITNAPVEVVETTRREAEAMGALAFFGDRYGERVRVVRAGPHSLELCGGTHVDALGMVGPVLVVQEGSIGANTRRIEAVTGTRAVELVGRRDELVRRVAQTLRTDVERLHEAVEDLLERERRAAKELERLRAELAELRARELLEGASDGVVVARVDGVAPEALRRMAEVARRNGALRAVVLGGAPSPGRAAVAASTDGTLDAAALVAELGRMIGGGGGGGRELALAGGRDPSGLDRALERARALVG
jgi:alanyl-tRNA synthetase